MKKLIISVLLITIPTISNAVRDDLVIDPMLPQRCVGVTCPAGQIIHPETCECVTFSLCNLSPSDCSSGYYLDSEACKCYKCNVSVSGCEAENTNFVIQSGTNKMVGVFYTFNASTCSCVKHYLAACVPGYYGAAKTSTATQTAALNGVVCTACPDGGTSTSFSGTASAQYMTLDYNDLITSCYLRTNTTHTDESGTFTYTGDCYYK